MATILIVDDSDSLRLAVVVALRGAGHQVLEARDGAEGRDIATRAVENAIDLVITDLNMPVLDGISMVRHIRLLPHMAKVPVFMLTTESSLTLRKTGKELGILAWVIKPFRPESILPAITQVLAMRAG